MGIIELENMEFYAFHGCFKEEQIVGNKFLVSLRIETDCTLPAQSDNIVDALNYLTVYQLVQKQMEIKSHLLENVAKRVLDSLYLNFEQINKAEIKISKMNPPLGGKLEKVSVTLIR